MDGRSTNALTTLCSAISQRAISIIHEVQVSIEPLGSGLDRASEDKLSELKNALEELKDRASQLDASLRTSTVSMAAHDAFLQHLTTCDGTLAILYKQVLRLQAETLDRINIEFVVAYNQTIQANSQLLEGFIRVAAV